MKYLRFKYILPRLFLIFLILLATEYGSGYLVRWGLIAAGEASVGAKVEIARVETSLLSSRLLISDLAIANPNSPMKNLMEADRVEIDFSSSALLRKKLIADRGIVSGLQFSTPRETSGELPDRPASPDEEPKDDWLAPLAKGQAEGWLNDLESRFSADVRDQLHSIRLAEEMADKWPERYQQFELAARGIKADAKRLEEKVRLARKNPLRNMEFLTQLPQETAKLRRALRDLQAELTALPTELAADREAVLAARVHDEKIIREHLEFDAIDAQSLTNYLLGEQITGPVGEAIAWMQWARQMVPARGPKNPTAAGRGEDVFFAGSKQLPNLLVKALRLEGAARMGGQPVQIVGVIRDWTTQPEFHSKPTTLELTTTGGMPLSVKARLDRAGEVPYDEFFVDSSGMVLPKLDLGKKGPLQLAVSKSTANVTVRMVLHGDRLEGEIQISQRGLAITPTLQSNLLGGRMQTALAESVSRIDSSQTEVTLGGTLDAPQMQFSSTLGTALAGAIQQSANDMARAEADRLVAQSRKKVDEQLAKFTSEFEQFQTKLAGDMAGPGEIIASLLGQRGEGTPQIGRSPFGQLFK